MEDNKMNETYDRMPMIGDPAPEFRVHRTDSMEFGSR